MFFYIFRARLATGEFPRHASPVTPFGGHKAVVRPDPIPNSAVKHSLADGSSPIGSARVGCRQFFKKSPRRKSRAFSFIDGGFCSRLQAQARHTIGLAHQGLQVFCRPPPSSRLAVLLLIRTDTLHDA